MKIKLIRAATMRAALTEAHRLMGPDALILESRKVGVGIEISVAVDPEETLDHREQWHEALAFHRVPADLAGRLRRVPPDRAVADTFRFGAVDFNRPLLLVGPPGAGKTMTTVKLATRLVLDGIRPTVINADQNRAGASAQLAALCRILRADFIDTATHEAGGSRARRRRPTSATLIDLPGMDPFDDQEMSTLRHMIDQVQGVAALVMPAGLDAQDSAEMAERFHAAGATMLIPTRLDLTRRLGGMVAAAAAAPLVFSHAGTSGRITEALEPMTPQFLARRLLDHNRSAGHAHAA